MMKRIWVYDLETLNIFTATFLDKNSDEIRTFVISADVDQRNELFLFLETEVSGLVGYNCINFDSQILEYLYRNPTATPNDIRNYAQIIVDGKDFPDVAEWRLKIPHLDLYKIHHFDNKNKRTSLKWCEFGLDLENIEDMPSDGEGDNWTEKVLSYNLNDVIATKKLYEYTTPMIELRKQLSSMYNMNFMNCSDSKIGSDLTLKLYCEATGKLKNDVKSLRTYRPTIEVKNILFDYIKFDSQEFNLLLKTFQNLIISNTKSEEKKDISVRYKDFEFVYGKGGIHGSLEGVNVKSDNNYIIIDADVSSLYPSIAIVNNLYPKHLGVEFTKVYNEKIVIPRIQAKKEGNKVLADGFKLAANSVYGKSNDIYSWLYDPQYTMATTINGQLLLTMLAEKLMNIPDSKIIQINTDGLTMLIPKSEIDLYYAICQNWETLTKLQLEYAEYSQMIIWDVNNYLAFYTNGKYKAKGRCEFENIPLHKNKSFSIIPYAVYKYFKNNISVEKTIKNHKNIFDFCGGVRSKWSEKSGKSHYELHSIKNGELHKQKLSKTVRYFISNKGSTLIKVYENGNWEHVEAPYKKKNKVVKPWKVTYFNKSYQSDDYDIDYSYYIIKAKEWIAEIENKQQLTLF